MTKLQRIISETVDGVRHQIENSIIAGETGMHYEKAYGNAYIDIDMNWSSCQESTEVMVSHVDTCHQSPLLQHEIMMALPWAYEVERRLTA